MYRQFSIVLLAVLFISATGEKKPPTDLEKRNLRGSVKTLTEVRSEILSDSTFNIVNHSVSEFSKSGMLEVVKEIRNGTLFSKKIYDYSIDQKLQGYSDYNADGSLYLRVTYSFDENGFLIGEKFDRTQQKLYNQNRQRVFQEYEKVYENMFVEVVYKCDFKGHKIEQKYLNANGSLMHLTTYKYDYKYFRVEEKYFNADRKAVWRTKFKQNSHGFVQESKKYISNRLAVTSNFSYQYDAQGNWVERFEKRKVEDNILTVEINRNNIIITRVIEYW